MKRLFVTVALLAAVVLTAADTALFKYAPNNTTAAAEVDVAALLKHPAVVKTLNNPEHLKTRLEWERKTGLRLLDFKKIVFFVNPYGKGIVLLNVDKNLDLEKFFTQNQISFQKLTVADKRVLQVLDPVKQTKTAELLLLAPGIIIAGEKGDIAAYLNNPRGNVRTLTSLGQMVPAGNPFWAVFYNTFKNSQGQVDDPQKLYFTFRFTGKEQKDLAFSLKLFCSDENGAQMLTGMLPFYANMGCALLFNQDPALSGELVALLKPAQDGQVVSVDVNVSAALVEKISAYLEKNAKKFVKKKKGSAGKRKSAPKAGKPAGSSAEQGEVL